MKTIIGCLILTLSMNIFASTRSVVDLDKLKLKASQQKLEKLEELDTLLQEKYDQLDDSSLSKSDIVLIAVATVGTVLHSGLILKNIRDAKKYNMGVWETLDMGSLQFMAFGEITRDVLRVIKNTKASSLLDDTFEVLFTTGSVAALNSHFIAAGFSIAEYSKTLNEEDTLKLKEEILDLILSISEVKAEMAEEIAVAR